MTRDHDQRSEYRSLLADLYLDAVELARTVASKPGATAADVVRALGRPLVEVEVHVGIDPAPTGEEPTSPGRPSPLRATCPSASPEVEP